MYASNLCIITILFIAKILNNYHHGIKQTGFLIDRQTDSIAYNFLYFFNCIVIFFNICQTIIRCLLLSERNNLYFSAHENRGILPYTTISFKAETIPLAYFIFNT